MRWPCMRGRPPVLCGCPVGPWHSSHTGCHLAHVSLYAQAQPEGAAGVHFPPARRLQEVRPGRRCRGCAGQQPGGGASQDRQQRGRERWCWRCRSWRRRSRHRRRYVMHTTRCTGCPKPASHTHIHQTPTLSMAMHSYLCLPILSEAPRRQQHPATPLTTTHNTQRRTQRWAHPAWATTQGAHTSAPHKQRMEKRRLVSQHTRQRAAPLIARR